MMDASSVRKAGAADAPNKRLGNGSMTDAEVSRSKRLGIISLLLFAALCGVWVYVFPKPPKEKQLIDNFYAHQAAYEQLRDMLVADNQLLRVANWGVETTNLGPHQVGPQGDFPLNRYNQYLELLKQTGAKWAFRGRGEHPEVVGVGVWASGWGGDTRHIEICWTDHEPANQVANLDDYYRTPKPRHPAFRHIDGNWYLYA